MCEPIRLGSGGLKLAPGTRDARRLGERAVSATALAGCGRGRDGRGCEEWPRSSTRAPRVRHGRGTDASPMTGLVTEIVGSPRFRACWSTVTTTMQALWLLWRLQSLQHAFRPSIQVRKAHESAWRPQEAWSSRHLRRRPGLFVASLARDSDVSPTS